MPGIVHELCVIRRYVCHGIIPFPPGQVLMISTSSGVALYTAATPDRISNKTSNSCHPILVLTAICGSKIHANDQPVLSGDSLWDAGPTSCNTSIEGWIKRVRNIVPFILKCHYLLTNLCANWSSNTDCRVIWLVAWRVGFSAGL